MATSETHVGKLAEIQHGGCIKREIGGRQVAIFRAGDNVYAIDAMCPHRGGPLDESIVDDELAVMCPWHGWMFDVRTGVSTTHPARVRSYAVRIEQGEVYIGAPNI